MYHLPDGKFVHFKDVLVGLSKEVMREKAADEGDSAADLDDLRLGKANLMVHRYVSSHLSRSKGYAAGALTGVPLKQHLATEAIQDSYRRHRRKRRGVEESPDEATARAMRRFMPHPKDGDTRVAKANARVHVSDL